MTDIHENDYTAELEKIEEQIYELQCKKTELEQKQRGDFVLVFDSGSDDSFVRFYVPFSGCTRAEVRDAADRIISEDTKNSDAYWMYGGYGIRQISYKEYKLYYALTQLRAIAWLARKDNYLPAYFDSDTIEAIKSVDFSPITKRVEEIRSELGLKYKWEIVVDANTSGL